MNELLCVKGHVGREVPHVTGAEMGERGEVKIKLEVVEKAVVVFVTGLFPISSEV